MWQGMLCLTLVILHKSHCISIIYISGIGRGLLLGLFGLLAHCIDNFYIICTQASLRRPSKGSKNWGYLANKVWKRQMSKRSHFVLHPAFFRRPWSDRHYSVLHFPQWTKLPQNVQKNLCKNQDSFPLS